jgi:phospholipid N-methyltransferase
MKNNLHQYSLSHPAEAKRLTQQSKNEAYLLSRELELLGFDWHEGEVVIDAGCGSGVLLLEMLTKHSVKVENLWGIDGNLNLVQETQKRFNSFSRSAPSIVHGDLKSSLVSQGLPGAHHLFCRYVLQHNVSLNDQYRIIQNLYQSLEKQGVLYIIDVSGFFSQMWFADNRMQSIFRELQSKFPVDFDVGLKIHAHLSQMGIKSNQINCQLWPFPFLNLEQKRQEAELWEQRITQTEPILKTLLSEFDQTYLRRNFCHEFLKESTTFAPTKYLFKITKK